MQPYYLGLSMGGSVSVGPYSAGVIDFLIETIDRWQAERERQIAKFGDRYSEWTVPPHQVQLAVIAGASAGGITAALAGAAIVQDFNPIHEQSPAHGSRLNNLFRSWVVDGDVRQLLGHSGLDNGGATLQSLLDTGLISNNLARALEIDRPLAQPRTWVRDRLNVILARSNAPDRPHPKEGHTGADFACDCGDYRIFEVGWHVRAFGEGAVPLPASSGDGWRRLAKAAIAATVFPFPEAEAAGNDPDSAARRVLSDLPAACPEDHKRRDPKLADRAIINIAPSLPSLPVKFALSPEDNLNTVLASLIGALMSNGGIRAARLQPAGDPPVASRWVIAPRCADPACEPLAGSLLGGFGGLISQSFREHDYQLGRRNCQQFLRRHFGLAWDNPIMRRYDLSAAAKSRLDAEFGFDAEGTARGDPSGRLFPLIPLVPALRPEICVARNAIEPQELEKVVDAALDRVRRTIKAPANDGKPKVPAGLALERAWPLVRGKIRGKLLTHIGAQLLTQGFARGPAESANLSARAAMVEIQKLRDEIAALKRSLQ